MGELFNDLVTCTVFQEIPNFQDKSRKVISELHDTYTSSSGRRTMHKVLFNSDDNPFTSGLIL